LRQLRRGNLVTARRSSADGRDTYYTLDLARCGELLASAGAALHPGLDLARPDPPLVRPRRPAVPALFLGTGNGSRSQMAEALLGERTDGVRVSSAGSHPKPVHPDAVRVMAEYGIDLSSARAKHLEKFASRRLDYVITLCDRVREVCPEWPGRTQ